MRKIILFIDSLTQGGAQRQLVGLSVLLKAKGYIVQVVTYHNTPFYEGELVKYGIRHLCIHKPKRNIGLIWCVWQAFLELQPDVVISYLDSPNSIACIVRLIGMNFRLIVSERNSTQRLTKKEKVKFFLYRWADIIVSNSFSQERFVSNHYPNLCSKNRIITNFVDLDVFRPTRKQIGGDAIKIIGVGRIEPQKNIGCLIKATKIVVDQGYNIHIDWYGRKTDLISDYENMLKELNLTTVFVFQEPTILIHEKYQEADLFCLPSLYEGYPNVLCEAMACGLPVICSSVCDNPSIIQENVNGYLFNPHDHQELAGQIIRFISTSEEEKKLMGGKSRELAELQFGKGPFVEKYLKLIRQLCK